MGGEGGGEVGSSRNEKQDFTIMCHACSKFGGVCVT